MTKLISFSLLFLFSIIVAGYIYLDRGLPSPILAAEFTCLSEEDGAFLEEDFELNAIYGIGLSYANHINETASEFSPNARPPVFTKSRQSFAVNGDNVPVPSSKSINTMLDSIEPSLTNRLTEEQLVPLPLIDHEVELAIVLLSDINNEELAQSDFVPQIGFAIANDLSARSLAVMGEGQTNRYDYWGASKSFEGFTPISSKIWMPNTPASNAIPCVTLTTTLNGEVTQKEQTSNLIYRPLDMLRFIQETYPENSLRKGDVILSGTPGGVIFSTPRWKVRIAKLLGFDRFQKLKIVQKPDNAARFMQAGDTVKVSGEWLGSVTTRLVN